MSMSFLNPLLSLHVLYYQLRVYLDAPRCDWSVPPVQMAIRDVYDVPLLWRMEHGGTKQAIGANQQKDVRGWEAMEVPPPPRLE